MKAYLIVARKSTETMYISNNEILDVASLFKRNASLSGLQIMQQAVDYVKKIDSSVYPSGSNTPAVHEQNTQ